MFVLERKIGTFDGRIIWQQDSVSNGYDDLAYGLLPEKPDPWNWRIREVASPDPNGYVVDGGNKLHENEVAKAVWETEKENDNDNDI